jgi:hypothetical protein
MNSPQDIARFQARMQTYRNKLQQYKTHLSGKVPTPVPILKRSAPSSNTITDIDSLCNVDSPTNHSYDSLKKIKSANYMCVTIYPFLSFPKTQDDKIMGSKYIQQSILGS